MLHEMLRSEFVPDSDGKILVQHNLVLAQGDPEFHSFIFLLSYFNSELRAEFEGCEFQQCKYLSIIFFFVLSIACCYSERWYSGVLIFNDCLGYFSV